MKVNLDPHRDAIVALIGFVSLLGGMAWAWSPAVAAMVGGLVLMFRGTWTAVIVRVVQKRTR